MAFFGQVLAYVGLVLLLAGISLGNAWALLIGIAVLVGACAIPIVSWYISAISGKG